MSTAKDDILSTEEPCSNLGESAMFVQSHRLTRSQPNTSAACFICGKQHVEALLVFADGSRKPCCSLSCLQKHAVDRWGTLPPDMRRREGYATNGQVFDTMLLALMQGVVSQVGPVVCQWKVSWHRRHALKIMPLGVAVLFLAYRLLY